MLRSWPRRNSSPRCRPQSGALNLNELRQLPRKLQELAQTEVDTAKGILQKEVLTVGDQGDAGEDGCREVRATAAAATKDDDPLNGMLVLAAANGNDLHIANIYEQMVELVYRVCPPRMP